MSVRRDYPGQPHLLSVSRTSPYAFPRPLPVTLCRVRCGRRSPRLGDCRQITGRSSEGASVLRDLKRSLRGDLTRGT
jgi:hypothetical protein